MKIITALVSILKHPTPSEARTPDGLCPNCWGRQEYGGAFFEAVKNENIDINDVEEHKGWIQDYAEKNLSGIRLKAVGEDLVCPNCKITYRPT